MSRTATRTVGVVLGVIALAAACGSMKTPPDTATAQFFKNPDRVWAGIQETLQTLGYEVESSNRTDGVIRAVKSAGDDSPAVMLQIDQVMRTLDQVNVYVRPAAADPGDPPSREDLDRAAQDFVTVLERKMAG